MYDILETNFAFAVCANDSAEEAAVVKPSVSTLDLIDEKFAFGVWRDNLKDIRQLLTELFHQLTDITSKPNFHSVLMNAAGNNHALSYSGFGRTFKMRLLLSKSGIDMAIEKANDDFAYRCLRRNAVLLSSVHSKTVPTVNLFQAAPVNEDRYSYRTNNVFVPPMNPLQVIGFKTPRTPLLSMGVLPLLSPKEINYLQHIVDKYGSIEHGIPRVHFIQSLKEDKSGDFNFYFGILYQWGLVKNLDNTLHFNMPVIKAILSKLNEIDFEGVISRDKFSYLAVFDKLLQGEYVKRTDISKRSIDEMESKGLLHFDKKVKTGQAHYTVAVCTPTSVGIKIFEAWVDVYKMVEPYVQALRNKND